ncbi:hypothetical protein COOONC_09408 [Cooperia oncophora]
MIIAVLLLPTTVAALCSDTATCISRVLVWRAATISVSGTECRPSGLLRSSPSKRLSLSGKSTVSSQDLPCGLFEKPSDISQGHISSPLRSLSQFFNEIFWKRNQNECLGEYRACDHDFRAGNGSVQIVEADPDMSPVAPFFIRSKPEITWHGLQYDEEFIIAIIDVGFGSLNYLVTGFPRQPMVLHDYEPSENFRPEPNPMVVAIFRKSKALSLKLGRPDDFDISKFMLDNDLADDLIGLSLIIVGSDAFAIERQRLRGTIDNCHSLLRSKLLRHPPAPSLNRLPLEELNSWLTVSVELPQLDVNVCCQQVRQKSVQCFFL